MSTRSLNVPGSLSSALATRKWGNDAWAATACHFASRRERGAAPPNEATPHDFIDHRGRPDLDRLAQRFEAAVADVRLERGRIDNAGPTEQHETRLAALWHRLSRVPFALGQWCRNRCLARLDEKGCRCSLAQPEARRPSFAPSAAISPCGVATAHAMSSQTCTTRGERGSSANSE